MTTEIIRVEPTPKEVELTGTTAAKLAAAEAFTIVTDEDAKVATDMAKQLASALRGLNDERLAITKPFRDGVAAINGRFEKLESTIEKANKIIRTKLLEHQQLREAEAKEARERQAALDAAREQEEREQRERDEAERVKNAPESQASDAPLAPVIPEIAPVFIEKAAPKQIITRLRSESGAVASIKKVWKARVTNIAELAMAYPELVEVKTGELTKLMNSAINKDRSTVDLTIPGVEWYQEDQLGIR